MRGTNSKNEEKRPKNQTIFLGLLGEEMRLNSRDLQKVHLGSLLNVHT